MVLTQQSALGSVRPLSNEKGDIRKKKVTSAKHKPAGDIVMCEVDAASPVASCLLPRKARTTKSSISMLHQTRTHTLVRRFARFKLQFLV